MIPCTPSICRLCVGSLTSSVVADKADPPLLTRQVPLPDFKANLHTIISLIRSPDSPYYSPTTSLLLLTPPPVDAAKWHANLLANVTPEIAARLTPDRSAENTQRYAQAVKEVGFEAGVPVVDVWTAIAAAAGAHPEGLGAFLSDGLHLTVAGYRIVTDGKFIVTARAGPHSQHLGDEHTSLLNPPYLLPPQL